MTIQIKFGKKKLSGLAYLLVISFLLGFILCFLFLRNIVRYSTYPINEKQIVFTELNQEIHNLQRQLTQLRGSASSIITSLQPSSPDILSLTEAKEIANNIKISGPLEPSGQLEAPPVVGDISDKLQEESIPTEETRIEYTPLNLLNPLPASSSKEGIPPGFLIVGGTDGSGTRSVVKKLMSLGALMITDDTHTYDIHASIVNGWPNIVKPVLRETRNLLYTPSTLKPTTFQEINKSVYRLLKHVENDAKKYGVNRFRKQIQAKGVTIGFKAPVAMTLLPFWVKNLPHFRFIQVVRDGRDIAFSSNQSPVEKFYQDMYSQDMTLQRLSTPLKAIKLWSDWNSQALDWSNQLAEAMQGKKPDNPYSFLVTNEDKSRSFGYLTVYTEDLVNDNLNVRFLALYRIAKFIESDLTNEQICSLAISKNVFMGSSDPGNAEAVRLVQKYGKWKQKVATQPELLPGIQRYGQEGLSKFGYEPMRTLANEEMVKRETNGYICASRAAIQRQREQKRMYII